MMPESLALVHIGDMHLDDRPRERVKRVEDGDRGVGEGGGIDDDAGGALAGGVNEVDDLVFAIALMELDLKPELLADAAAVRLDVGQRLAAVDLRLALAEQIEIGSVQDNNDRAHRASPQWRRGRRFACVSTTGGRPAHAALWVGRAPPPR